MYQKVRSLFFNVNRRLKFAFQRAYRGYDDTVYWSLCYHLAHHIPTWVRNYQWMSVRNYYHADVQKHDQMLEDIAQGFEAAIDIMDCQFKSKEEEDQLKKKFNRGMDTLRDNFFRLWT